MPPKLENGNWILPHGGRLIFEDGSPVVIVEAELPPEPGGELPDFGLHEMSFEGEMRVSHRYSKSLIKAIHLAENRQKRTVRTAKRQREKERRQRVKNGR